ncbi:hypothetical protein GCM10022402_10150 [Salinactinospora qingdaonensis]|uniref:Uncharacterized protein n=2 Tax=Salinactinospora qingdaonensis TaxID=702744 RepID=A0ABP7F4V8_9ACTN
MLYPEMFYLCSERNDMLNEVATPRISRIRRFGRVAAVAAAAPVLSVAVAAPASAAALAPTAAEVDKVVADTLDRTSEAVVVLVHS